ncbi:MAG TPA: (d)CMP kinase [Phycisphaerales bacterium]|nr:(d)CMP kinase [Phycisphaerales bacterium]
MRTGTTHEPLMIDATAKPGGGGGGGPLPDRFVVTIDGQASTGKSSVGQKLARRLHAAFLDTGAMYRAVTALCIDRGVATSDDEAVLELAKQADISFDWSSFPPKLHAFGVSIADRLRSSAVDGQVSVVAAIGPVREYLVQLQRWTTHQRPRLVTEGRDQGTIVFPDAMAKFFLVADPEERARRRCAQNQAADYDAILRNLIDRDRRDSSRAVGPMAVAPDAAVIDTTRMTEEQVVDHLESHVRAAASRRAARGGGGH